MDFIEILGMQKQLDEAVGKPRENGFVPRERTLLDIRLSIDDEFQEWLRELPNEYNFNKDEIIETYVKKWNKNMERINKEWTLGGNK